jgi:hypothetical protein
MEERLMVSEVRKAVATGLVASVAAIVCNCSSHPSSDTPGCMVGTEGCLCTNGGACDPGLDCLSQHCVNLSHPGAGGGSSVDGGSPVPPGNGTDAGSGGGPDASVPTCAVQTDCAASEVCILGDSGTGYCNTGSGKPCDGSNPICLNGQGFAQYTTLPPDDPNAGFCNAPADCPMGPQFRVGLCAPYDRATAGHKGICVELCQYRDDPSVDDCVTGPHGLSSCSRIQGEIMADWVLWEWWIGHVVKTISCVQGVPVSTDLQWTSDCLSNKDSISAMNCFSGFSTDPNAKMTTSDWTSAVKMQIQYTDAPAPGASSGSAGQCGADCDCGHCSYCESGQCRYGGEGPSGCYRGCN